MRKLGHAILLAISSCRAHSPAWVPCLTKDWFSGTSDPYVKCTVLGKATLACFSTLGLDGAIQAFAAAQVENSEFTKGLRHGTSRTGSCVAQ